MFTPTVLSTIVEPFRVTVVFAPAFTPVPTTRCISARLMMAVIEPPVGAILIPVPLALVKSEMSVFETNSALDPFGTKATPAVLKFRITLSCTFKLPPELN